MKMKLYLLAACIALSFTGTAEAKLKKLPPLPNTWVNSGPRHMEDLNGKAIVMIFFHDGGQQFEILYPQFARMAEEYKEKPVLFLCVNSNNEKHVRDIAYKRQIRWPIIADERGKYTYDWGFRGINAEYDIHYGVVNASGLGEFATTEQVREYLDTFLKSAKWKIDPKQIPDALQKAWREYEFGDNAAALSAMRVYAGNSRPEIKEAFELIYGEILKSYKARMAEAKRLDDLGQKWKAYKTYLAIQDAFKGLKEIKEANIAVSKLRRDKQVSLEINLFKFVESQQQRLRGNNIMFRLDAEKKLQAMARKYPDAEASRLALSMIK